MKNLFEIDSDEIKRILSLHETSTKQQYLNILTEQISQNKDSYTLSQAISLENTKLASRKLRIFKGTVFTQSDKPGVLKSNSIQYQYVETNDKLTPKSGVVYYNCQKGKFFIPGNNDSFYFSTGEGAGMNGPIAIGVKTVCNYNHAARFKKPVDPNQKPVGPNQKPPGSGPVVSTQQKTQQKNNFTALYTIANNHDLGPVKVNAKDIVIKSFKHPNYAAIMRGNTPIAYYNCSTNTWGSIQITDTKGLLTKTIKEKVCPKIVTSSPVVDANGQTVVDDSKLTPKQKEYKDKVSGINKQIQTALGVQGGDGNLTQADYQAIYNKLLQ